MIDKKQLNEADLCTKIIEPALDRDKQGSWDLMNQIQKEYSFTAGRVVVQGNKVSRRRGKRADYILFYKPNIPIAVIEVKTNDQPVGGGMQQALDYAEILDLPFAFSTNGDAFLEHDRTPGANPVEREIPLDQFPGPSELWRRYSASKGYTREQEEVTTFDYYNDGSGKKPRYYQMIAINRTVDAIARGQKRLLLVMATGTGKTYTAFQIIWRLWKSAAKKRILFLVDRNILADQTRTNDFKPFGQAMTKITRRTIDKSYEVYLCLYQAVTGKKESSNVYKQFSPEFFDLVVVDECHRGSAADDAAWRQILEYFSSATQIGLTATPKETETVSNIEYFGEPIYTYSLRQGILDGFLAPYKVVRIGLDKDLDGWRPEIGKRDRYGLEIEDKEYKQGDMDIDLVLKRRTEVVAAKVTEFLRNTDRFNKTIVFCENIEHAERMRQALVNANPDLAGDQSKYVMRITGDNKEGKAQLDNFIDPESTYPVIATTSDLMSTGVDAQTCHLIVLDKTIKSLTIFKQIIGRGTRINEDYGKLFFTIMDFKQATRQFADPNFDGEAVQVLEKQQDEPLDKPDEGDSSEDVANLLKQPPTPGEPLDGGEPAKRKKYYVDDVEVTVVTERNQLLGKDGRLIADSTEEYSRKLILASFPTLADFQAAWQAAERKQALLEELTKKEILLDELARLVGREYDDFDIICHIGFDQAPRTRKERAEVVRQSGLFDKYEQKPRAILEILLEKYAEYGISNVESMEILLVNPLRGMGTPMEIVKIFGGKMEYRAAIRDLVRAIYPVT